MRVKESGLRPLDGATAAKFASQHDSADVTGYEVGQLFIADTVSGDGVWRNSFTIVHEGTPAGYVCVETTRETPGLLCHVAALWVQPDRRRQGCAAGALEAVRQLAEAAGCGALEVTVDARNAAAVTVFGRNGYVFAGWNTSTLMRLQRGVTR